MRRSGSRFIWTGLYVGCLPGAPGTYGSLWGVAIYLAGIRMGLATPLCLLALLGAGWYTLRVGRGVEDASGTGDPGEFVLDEVAGMLVAVLFQQGMDPRTTVLGAFLLFRLFDIAKPFPLRRLERLGGGAGILADDLGAGLAANLLLRLVPFLAGAG